MENSKSKMKEMFSQFVDTLVEDELESIRLELIKQKTEILMELDSFKKEVKESLAETVSSVTDQMDDMKATVENLDSSETITQLQSDIGKVNANMEKLATRIAETFSHHEEDFESGLSALEKRVFENEKLQQLVREDHGKISMLLNSFASNITSTTQSIRAIPDTDIEPAPVKPVTEPVEKASVKPLNEPEIEATLETTVDDEETSTDTIITNEPQVAEKVTAQSIVADVLEEDSEQTIIRPATFEEITPEFNPHSEDDFELDLSDSDDKAPFAGMPEVGEPDVTVNESGQHIYR